MAQRKEIKKNVKVRDLKPKKDAKGGFTYQSPRPSGAGHQYAGPKQQGPERPS